MHQYPTTPPSTAAFCFADGCLAPPSEPGAAPVARPAVRGTDLCLVHHTQFQRVLKSLAIAAGELASAAYRKRSGDPESARVRTSGVADVSAAWNPAATEALSVLADWSTYLVRTILKEAPLPAPEVKTWIRNRTVRDEHTGRIIRGAGRYVHKQVIEHHHAITLDTPTPLALATIAKHYAGWLSAYPEVGPTLLAEAVDHARAAQRALNAPPVRRGIVSGAACPETIAVDGLDLVCGSAMFALIDDDDRVGALLCSRYPESHRRFEPAEWAEFLEVPDAG